MSLVAASLVALLPSAFAGSPSARDPSAAPAAETGTVDAADASHCARAAELLGKNCSYSTGTMARRVLEEGTDWTYSGALVAAPNNLATMVAAPFTVADGVHVIANELVEVLSQGGHADDRLSVAGKLLEVDGVRYVVLTSYRVINS
jgi:hypothetical protein